ncbi:hypothetical protein ACFLYZ_01430 [Thermodesulfobacteriota bacterium]
MNSCIKKYYLILLTAAIFCLPVSVKADDLDQKIQDIVESFEQQIQSTAGGQEYFLAVRSFFDEVTNKPSLRSEEIRDKIFQIIRDRYRGKSKIIILNWRSEKPLEKNVASTAGEIIYKQGVLAKQLLKDFGKGFLITGTTATIADSAVINTELIDMQSGSVLMSLKASLALGAEEVILAKKTALSEQVGAEESAPAAPQTEPPEKTGAEDVVPAQKAQGSLQAAPVDTAAAVKAVPAQIKAAPEAENEGLEYKVIEGVNFKYEGHLKDGKKHGQGTLTFNSGDKYMGQWRNDKKHGQGTYIFADGAKYVGQWKDNMMHGQGTYFFKSGNKYVGQWHNDKKHGQGTHHFKNGDKWEGTYSNNKKHGYGIYTWASGKSTKEYWQDGKLVK